MGVEKETIKEGDGTNFPKTGDELTMVSYLCERWAMTFSNFATIRIGASPISRKNFSLDQHD